MTEEKTIEWFKEGEFGVSLMVDQTLIPYEYKKVKIKTVDEMFNAIKTMIVRGAPAIGIAGAHGAALAAIELIGENDFINKLYKKMDYINSSRPTAVNLSWAIKEQKEIVEKNKEKTKKEIIEALIQNAIKLENEDIEINKKIGDFGAELVPNGAGILTHCNAGALATVGYGTALGVIRSAYKKDKNIMVYADETRPRQQGARITTYELIRDGIPTTLITDGMCSYFMKKGMINFVVTGADRIAANGDTANKIGTSTIAIAAKFYGIPFYIAAPKSTIDMTIKTGDDIVIELRDEDEVKIINGKPICADGVRAINPSFDVTDHSLIKGIITEYGVFRPEELKQNFS